MNELILGGLLGFLLAALLRDSLLLFGLRSLLLAPFGKLEFFDKQELLLNVQLNSSWGNLGYWKDGYTYQNACQELATRLGNQCSLNGCESLLDIGFGNGDQILLWKNQFHVNQIEAYNISHSQTEFAKELLRNSGGVALHQGTFSDVPQSQKFDRVVALDCAYHFQTREEFLKFSLSRLNPRGSVALVDLFVKQEGLNFGEALTVRLMAWASRIPRENLWSESQYRSHLETLSYGNIEINDITKNVFEPFKAFVFGHKERLGPFVSRDQWLKYVISARVLSWLAQRKVIQLSVITAQKT